MRLLDSLNPERPARMALSAEPGSDRAIEMRPMVCGDFIDAMRDNERSDISRLIRLFG